MILLGEQLHAALVKAMWLTTKWAGLVQWERDSLGHAASEFAKPYLERIAELESENKALRKQVAGQ